jgi:hypothetical protein
MTCRINPIGLPIVTVIGLFKGGRWLLFTGLPAAWKGVRTFAKFARRVVWLTFRWVHSEVRATCFVDSFLGATAGFFTGYPLVGLAVGIVLGLASYYLVRQRLLRLNGEATTG